MTSQARPAWWRRALGPVAAALVTLAIVLGASAPAAAHAELIDTDPDEGAVVETAPETVTLTFTEPVRCAVPVEDRGLGRTYIRATGGPDVTGGAFETAAAHARSSDAWRYHEIETTHMVPQNRPDELAAILLDLAT